MTPTVAIVHPVPRLRSDKGRRRYFADVRLDFEGPHLTILHAEFTELGPRDWQMRMPVSADGQPTVEFASSWRAAAIAAFTETMDRADRLAERERSA